MHWGKMVMLRRIEGVAMETALEDRAYGPISERPW